MLLPRLSLVAYNPVMDPDVLEQIVPPPFGCRADPAWKPWAHGLIPRIFLVPACLQVFLHLCGPTYRVWGKVADLAASFWLSFLPASGWCFLHGGLLPYWREVGWFWGLWILVITRRRELKHGVCRRVERTLLS